MHTSVVPDEGKGMWDPTPFRTGTHRHTIVVAKVTECTAGLLLQGGHRAVHLHALQDQFDTPGTADSNLLVRYTRTHAHRETTRTQTR